MKLTKPQKLIYDMERFAGGAINVICGSMLLSGVKTEAEMITAVNRVYQLNDALRIRISVEDGQPSQKVVPYAEKNIEVLHFATKAELDSYAQNHVNVPLDFHGDLCDIKVVILPEQYGILLKFHHMIGDAWTSALIGTQFNAIVNSEDPSACSYCEYVESEKEYLESQRYKNDRTFFLEQFKKCDEVTYLSEKQVSSYSATRMSFVLDAEKTQIIKDYATQNKTSAYTLFMTVLAVYMSRVRMNAEKFYLGTAVLNRSGAREKRTMGMFVNTVPMLMELDYGKSFAENLTAVGKTILSAFRHQKFNYGDVLSAIRKEYNFSEKLYDVMLSYQNATICGCDCETTWYHSAEQTESLVVHIDDRDNDGIFRVHYDYQVDRFTEQEIQTLHQHFMALMYDAIENDDKKLYELELLPLSEKQTLLYDFNDTAVDYPKHKCIHQLFEEQVKQNPHKTALVFENKHFTYKQLDEMSNSLANYLISQGVSKNDPIPILVKRSEHVIIGMLGVLKAGGAYVPLDFSNPRERIEYILRELNARVVLLYGRDDLCNTNAIKLGEFDYSSKPKGISMQSDADSLAYIIYTSGSTGNPKGTRIRHRNVVNYCFNSERNRMIRYLKDECNCKSIVSVNNICFDAFLDESLLPLLNGMTVFLANQEQSVNHVDFINLVNTNLIDIVSTTPTKIKLLTNGTQCYLKHIILGGEAVKVEDTGYLNAISNASLYNTYGPTETTCGSTYTQIKSSLPMDIHIGKPIANTQIYIVDKFMNIVPIGVTGELCIAGAGVGAGYLNRPELTAEKFVDNPFGEGKLYKTGDLAYWREDGNIAYVGRNDFQVKIRGLRIELGEIENAICGIDGISQAVVVVRKNSQGRQLICAFYTGTEIDAKEIRMQIGKKLPKYMLPHIFTHLQDMPMTSSGKVNRKALPEIDLENIKSDTEYVAPENEQQQLLCNLMQQVLDVTPVGIADDFFDLGGDSLKAIEFISEAHNEGIYINLQDVYNHPTIKQLWDAIEQGEQQRVAYDDVDFSTINLVLANNKLECARPPKKTKVGNLLLAGATGFLGIHILADYLENDTGTAYCLVRGKNQEESEHRLSELLHFYFGDKYAGSDRIKVVCSDLQKDNLGLTEEAYQQLLSKVDTVINAAASVKHYGVYQYFYDVNVETVKRLIAFCKQSNAKLIHISTLTVSGNGFDSDMVQTAKRFAESDLYIGQPLENVYARSKFEAEKAVLEAMSNGLQANIMRMGNLTNRVSDGVFQKNYESNAFLKRIRSLVKLGVYPESLYDFAVEFTPIDEAATAIMTITRHFSSEQTVFHISNPNVITLNAMFNLFSELGIEVTGVDTETFDHYLQTVTKQEGMEGVLDAFVNDFDGKNQLSYDSQISIENDFTVRYLKALGFVWADVGMDYLQKYVEYFRKIGYMEE